MHLDPPTSGKVYFEGRDISKMNKKELKAMRREMQFIFPGSLCIPEPPYDHR